MKMGEIGDDPERIEVIPETPAVPSPARRRPAPQKAPEREPVKVPA